MDPRNSQFGKRLMADTPAQQKSMDEGFTTLDKILQDKKPLNATKKKAIDAAYKKVSKGRGEM